MKKQKLFLGIFIIFAIKSYSQDIEIGVNTSLELTHFEQIFKKNNLSIPLDTLIYNDSKYYSYDKSLYIELIPKEKKYRLMTFDERFIVEIPYGSVYDKIIWLHNCVVINSNIEDFNHCVIYLVNLKDGKLSTYKAKGRYYYIGHSDSLCYFYSGTSSTYLGNFLIPKEGTIFSINESGPKLTDKKEREDGNKIIRQYYDESFSLVLKKDNAGKYSYNFHYFDSIWTSPEPINYFYVQDVYHQNGAYYVKINSKAIYRFDKKNVTKVIDCDTLSIDQFMIENNHLVYSINYDYQKPPLGILNLETMKTHYPAIVNKLY